MPVFLFLREEEEEDEDVGEEHNPIFNRATHGLLRSKIELGQSKHSVLLVLVVITYLAQNLNLFLVHSNFTFLTLCAVLMYCHNFPFE